MTPLTFGNLALAQPIDSLASAYEARMQNTHPALPPSSIYKDQAFVLCEEGWIVVKPNGRVLRFPIRQRIRIKNINRTINGPRTDVSDITTFTYDSVGNLTLVTDALQNSTTSQYDAKGRLISTRDALNQPTTFEYDDAGGGTGNLLRTTVYLEAEMTQVKIEKIRLGQ